MILAGQRVLHDFQKRKFHVINQLSARSAAWSVISKRLYLVISVPCGVAVNANQSLSTMSVRTFACLAEHVLQHGHDPRLTHNHPRISDQLQIFPTEVDLPMIQQVSI